MADRHRNLFAHGASKAEIYESLQREYGRDARTYAIWATIFAGCTVGIALSANYTALFLVGALISLERALNRWIDNSNRNWMMHAIDWYESEKRTN